jgi:hypothetical protein
VASLFKKLGVHTRLQVASKRCGRVARHINGVRGRRRPPLSVRIQ